MTQFHHHNHKPQAPLYLIAYDITDDKERRRVDDTLQGYGFRVQKSVYECHLTRGDKKRLLKKLQALNIETGHIRCYGVNQQMSVIGVEPEDIDDEFIYFIE